jgi:hypothetical protein
LLHDGFDKTGTREALLPVMIRVTPIVIRVPVDPVEKGSAQKENSTGAKEPVNLPQHLLG